MDAAGGRGPDGQGRDQAPPATVRPSGSCSLPQFPYLQRGGEQHYLLDVLREVIAGVDGSAGVLAPGEGGVLLPAPHWVLPAGRQLPGGNQDASFPLRATANVCVGPAASQALAAWGPHQGHATPRRGWVMLAGWRGQP